MTQALLDIDIFSPVVDALNEAVGSLIATGRVFFADTIGQFIVAIYTPVYCVLDFIIAGFQALFGLVSLAFGWLPAPIFLAVLGFILLYLVAYVARFFMTVIHG